MDWYQGNLRFLYQSRPSEDHGRDFFISSLSKVKKTNGRNNSDERLCEERRNKRKECDSGGGKDSCENECKQCKTDENEENIASNYARNWMNTLTQTTDKEPNSAEESKDQESDASEDPKMCSSIDNYLRSNDQFSSPIHSTDRQLSERDETKSRNKKKSKSNKIVRKLENISKQIEEAGEKVEASKGYRLSLTDKMQFEDLECLMFQQVDLLLKQNLMNNPGNKKEGETSPRKKKEKIISPRNSCRFTVKSSAVEDRDKLVARLRCLKLAAGRPEALEEMDGEQLLQEKVEMQEELTQYESLHGLQDRQENRDIMAQIYERYRLLLKMTKRFSSPRCSVTSLTLGSIPEHNSVDFSDGEDLADKPDQRKVSDASRDSWNRLPVVRLFNETEESAATVLDAPTDENRNFHTMSQSELLTALKNLNNSKKKYKREAKLFEEQFLKENRRSPTKEEKESCNQYNMYKEIKPKIKLIDALLRKYSIVPLDH